MNSKNIDLIKQSLNAAESSIKLAKQLLSELEANQGGVKIPSKTNLIDLPGITGIFDGEKMVSESGEAYPVPANYASKSMLVVGDTLKLVEEGKNKDKRFKQIEHVKRHKSTGILTKKDGKWKVVTPEGSYKVLGAAVEHFGADIGAEVTLHLPANNLTVAYGAIEAVKGKEKVAEKSSEPEVKDSTKTEIKPEPVKEEVKNEVNKAVEETTKQPAKELSRQQSKPAVAVKKPEPKREAPRLEPKKEAPIKPEVKLEPPVVVQPEKKPVVKVEPSPQKPKEEVSVTTTPAPAGPTVPMEVSPEEEELT